MLFQAQDLSHVLDPRITALVHDDLGPAGVVLCIPDLQPDAPRDGLAARASPRPGTS